MQSSCLNPCRGSGLNQQLQGLAAATVGNLQPEPPGTPWHACGVLLKRSVSTRWLKQSPRMAKQMLLMSTTLQLK